MSLGVSSACRVPEEFRSGPIRLFERYPGDRPSSGGRCVCTQPAIHLTFRSKKGSIKPRIATKRQAPLLWVTLTSRRDKGNLINRMSAKRQVDTAAFFATYPVFSLDQATTALAPSRGTTGTVDRLKHYLKSGRLKLLARGLYAAVPPGHPAESFQADSFLVAHAARPDGVFCYHGALELLGAAHSAWHQCTVFSMSRRSPLKLGGARVLFLEHPTALRKSQNALLGTKKVERRGQLLRVTCPERTLVEGFRRPELVGGLSELTTSAGGFASLDLAMLERVLKQYAAGQLWGAVGWFLERHQSTFHVPNAYLSRLEARRPRSPQYVPRGQRGGVLVARWNVILSAEVMRSEPDERQPGIS